MSWYKSQPRFGSAVEVAHYSSMHPYALAATPEERRKERSAARSLRQKRAA